jgi:hypothetical protein
MMELLKEGSSTINWQKARIESLMSELDWVKRVKDQLSAMCKQYDKERINAIQHAAGLQGTVGNLRRRLNESKHNKFENKKTIKYETKQHVSKKYLETIRQLKCVMRALQDQIGSQPYSETYGINPIIEYHINDPSISKEVKKILEDEYEKWEMEV